MNTPEFSPGERTALALLAIFGLVVPNGLFLYVAATDPGAMAAALSNPISLVFVFEAFLLMSLFAWLLGRSGARRPSGFVFVVLSLLGSLAFSVPWTLLRLTRRRPGS